MTVSNNATEASRMYFDPSGLVRFSTINMSALSSAEVSVAACPAGNSCMLDRAYARLSNRVGSGNHPTTVTVVRRESGQADAAILTAASIGSYINLANLAKGSFIAIEIATAGEIPMLHSGESLVMNFPAAGIATGYTTYQLSLDVIGWLVG